MKLLLVCGGQSTEHAVSRMSCVNIYKNADKTKYDIKVAGITKEGEWYDLVSTDFSGDNWLEGATKIADHFTFLNHLMLYSLYYMVSLVKMEQSRAY